MRLKFMIRLFLGIIVLIGLSAYTAVADEEDELLSKPKMYVGSEKCKSCHLPQYYSWKTTMHSRMIQDARVNKSVLIVELDEKRIRKDLAKLGKKLKVPADKIYVPKLEEVKYTIGSKWKQRFVVEKKGVLYIAPIQYNPDADKFVNYHEANWDKRPWLLKCGNCHNTGVDLEKQTFIEPAVGCEACHGKGSWHFADSTIELWKGLPAIINPAKLTGRMAAQICGSCHQRGKSTRVKGAGWSVGYEPGGPLQPYHIGTTYASGDTKHVYPNEYAKKHRMQYNDWEKSIHKKAGVTCSSCHYSHAHYLEKSKLWPPGGVQPGGSSWSPTPYATWEPSGDKQCLKCHVKVNKTAVHSIHTYGKCVGCHMPKIAASAQYGDISSHVFKTLLPADTIANPKIPNSCQACHKHKDEDVNKLNEKLKKIQAAMALGN